MARASRYPKTSQFKTLKDGETKSDRAVFRQSLQDKMRSLKSAPTTFPHVAVSAGAGTGKTSTMEAAYRASQSQPLPFRPTDSQQAVIDRFLQDGDIPTQFLAFNASIAQEFVNRGLPGRTFHSFGNEALRSLGVRFKQPNRFKTNNILEEEFGLKPRGPKSDSELFRLLPRLVSLCKNTLCGLPHFRNDPYARSYPESVPNVTADEIYDLVDHFSLDLSADDLRKCVELVNPVLSSHLTQLRKGILDFDDMIWGPLVLGLQVPRFGRLVVDECQDLNASRMVLARLSGERLYTVGDARQAIYGFSGADAHAFHAFQDWMRNSSVGVDILPLMETRRCPRAVVELVRHIVPEFRALPEAPEGTIIGVGPFASNFPSVPWDVLTGERSSDPSAKGIHSCWQGMSLLPGDMVLSATNAPTVSLAYKLIAAGKRCMIRGRDIGQGLLALIRRAEEKSGVKSIPELLGWLDDYESSEQAKLSASKRPNENALRSLEDRLTCLRLLASRVDNLGELVNLISSLFDTAGRGEEVDHASGKNLILLSTVHKAKGLEADRVFLLRPEHLPPPWAKQAWEQEQALNLQYVAYTRTKQTLVGTLTPTT